MTIHDQKIVIAHSRSHSAADRSGIERDIFSDRIVVTHNELARLPFILEILRNGTDARKGEKGVAFSDGSPALDHDVRVKFAPPSDLDPGPNNRIRSDLDARIQLSLGIDQSGLVNPAHACRR